MENILEIKNLKKYFKETKAVDDISFKVKRGEFFAFLGLNGAGKSTTINIICGQLRKDSGQVLIDSTDINKDNESFKQKLGVVFQDSVLDKALSVKENLKCRASLYNIFDEEFENKFKSLAKMFEFESFINQDVGKLSGGQRRRIDIARALIHKPQILILDEPTTGLDPQTRKLVWDNLNLLREKENITIFLTTHYMEETLDSDYVVILDSGKICAEGTPLELKNKFAKDNLTIYNITEEDIRKISQNYIIVPNGYRIYLNNTKEAITLLNNYQEFITDFEITKGKMDDVFLNVTGKILGEEK